jgi:hypothetical protein
LVVPLILPTKWEGYTTIFGNAKWGRGRTHPYNFTRGFWSECNWLVLRNPVNNLMCRTLAVRAGAYHLVGDARIGDKTKGGFYYARMREFWEFYWVKPYTVFGSKRCVRVRVGWKIVNSDRPAAFVFAISPFKRYLGQ